MMLEEWKVDLEKRVDELNTNIDSIKSITLSDERSYGSLKYEMPNRPGKQMSLKIISAKAKDKIIDQETAKECLDVFGKPLTAIARANKGDHPSIDILQDVADGKIEKLNVVIENYHAPETLSKEKYNFFKSLKKNTDPAFYYFEQDINDGIDKLAAFPGVSTLRYAMKANSDKGILNLVNKKGHSIDASTFNEAKRALLAGFDPKKVRITSKQVLNDQGLDLVRQGAKYTACSLLQAKTYGENFPNSNVDIRFNIGIGSGWTAATNTGGVNAPFGIYIQEHKAELDAIIQKYNLTPKTAHFHIGSGSDPKKQKEAVVKALDVLKEYPTIDTLNMGGGIKVARMSYEKATDIQELGKPVKEALDNFYKETGRKISLEIEPGTAIIANHAYMVSNIIDIITTGENGFKFLVSNAGMNAVTRTVMYTAQHGVVVVPMDNSKRAIEKYVVCGPLCESDDVLTPKPEFHGSIDERMFTEAKVGDRLITKDVGAYCRSMSPINYNSCTALPSYMVYPNETINLMESAQTLSDLVMREITPIN